MFTGLRDRLERELAEAAPHNAKVKVTSPANSLERKFSVWIGAQERPPAPPAACSLPQIVLIQGRSITCVYMSTAVVIVLQVGPSWHLWARSSRCGCPRRNLRSMERASFTGRHPRNHHWAEEDVCIWHLPGNSAEL